MENRNQNIDLVTTFEFGLVKWYKDILYEILLKLLDLDILRVFWVEQILNAVLHAKIILNIEDIPDLSNGIGNDEGNQT